jgi:hypothetical protein
MIGKIRTHGRLLRGILPAMFAERAAGQLRLLSQLEPTLSRDAKIESSHQQMLEKMDVLLSDLKR